MRLGAYACRVAAGTHAAAAYRRTSWEERRYRSGDLLIHERHRHRYEFDNQYRSKFERAGFVFSGVNPERDLVEIIELPRDQHPFFVGVQFHPEFKSRPLDPHPLFKSFIGAALEKRASPS